MYVTRKLDQLSCWFGLTWFDLFKKHFLNYYAICPLVGDGDTQINKGCTYSEEAGSLVGRDRVVNQ